MRTSLSAVLFFCSTLSASAQWVPVNGRVVATTETLGSDGKVVTRWSTTSQYSRSASGSVLIQRIGRSGKPATATLLDYGKTGKSYQLTYETGKVNDSHHPLNRVYGLHPPSGMTPAMKEVSLGTEKVNGINCFIVTIYDTGPNRSRVLIGKAWLAPAYNNLIVREDFTRTSPYGSKRHTVREFTIVNHSEPDATLFSTDRTEVVKHWKVSSPGAK